MNKKKRKQLHIKRKEINKIAYGSLFLCMWGLWIIILLGHFTLYKINETMFWVILSLLIIITYSLKIPFSDYVTLKK